MIWKTDGHAWFHGLTDMPGLMDWWTCLILWTYRYHQIDGLTDIPDFTVWLTCLIWWTDGYAWFDGIMDMPNLMDWWTCCHFCCHCCCGCCSSRHCVIIVVAAIDYNLICILWLMDFFFSHFQHVLMSGTMLSKFANWIKVL